MREYGGTFLGLHTVRMTHLLHDTLMYVGTVGLK